MNKIIIHIGARKNSTGVKNKNIKKILGKPLIQYSIEHAKNIKSRHLIVVSTDSKKKLKITKKLNVDLQIHRPLSLANSKASKFSVWKHSINYLLKNNYMDKDDIFLDLDCTCPVRNIKDIKLIIKKFKFLKKNKKSFDGILTVTKARKNPYFNLLEHGKNKFLQLSKKNNKKIFTRQSCPKVFEHTASIYCLKPDFILKKSFFMQGKLLGHEIEYLSGWDIDDKFDCVIVQNILKRKNV